MNPVIDLHQDLILYVSRPDLYEDKYEQTSFEQIKKNNLKITIASAFVVPPKENYLDPSVIPLIEESLKAYGNYCKAHPEFLIVKNRKDLEKVLNTEGLFGLLLHIEGLNVFDAHTDWQTLERFYEIFGLRSIGPMWNLDNPFGGGTLGNGGGLTRLG